ncbi:ABC transporter permease [Oceanirhabdus sp. W0125-5]|uniref:ABC transporter permease n=1 Tax=Oceanirhabdus sp. W0125-5 TaxID=2999116 RepID=UPI0022F32CE5|nr:ABC transporter permease [Oceanirhabdus sp. W0125-5]WBW97383.1 ABC transporter permease [Oceanirhabdus sp. W0125-5]
MNIILTVFKKEIKDIFRDKKTVITSILLPLILLPIIYGFMGRGISKDIDEVNEKLKIAIVAAEENSVEEYLSSIDNIEVIESDDIVKDINKGKIDAAVMIPEGIEEAIKENKTIDVEILYDTTSNKSSMTRSAVYNILNDYSKEIVKARLEEKNIDMSILTPFQLQTKGIEKDNKKDGVGLMLLSMLLPMLLIMYSATSPLPVAVDLAAGEKERGTLEPLLTTQANRTSLLWGKLFAITTMGIITVIASLTGLFIAIKRNPVLFGGASGAIEIDTKSLLLIGTITILVTMTFAALELSISIYARSFKEAQTYLTPVTLIGMFVGFGSYAINVKNVSNGQFFIPIYNAAICLKEIALGKLNYTHYWITIAVMIVAVIASILFTRTMFNKEKVIFRT